MIFTNDVILRVYPEKYFNDAYDIVNIFYGGAIRRGSRQCGANKADTSYAADVSDLADGADVYVGAEVGAGADCLDCISIKLIGNFCSIGLFFFQSGGRVVVEGAKAVKGSYAPARAEARINDGQSAAYQIKIMLYRELKKRAAKELGLERPQTKGDQAPPGGENALPRGERPLQGWEQVLPWGALVGVRPIKLYSELLDRGEASPAIVAYMARRYDIGEHISELCLRIAAAQKNILNNYDPDTDCLLYVGVPFCVSKCAYCSFPSDAHNKADVYASSYIDALLRELNFISEYIKGANRRIKAAYIGGGTPTALGPRELVRLLKGVTDVFAGGAPDEITVEAGRADTLNREKLKIIRGAAQSAGRLRLCINPQTMNEPTLRLIGREHTPDDVLKAFWLSREEGFDDINMDIIAGLPGEDVYCYKNTLEAISGLRPESMTSHTLCIKRSSRLNEFAERYEYPDAAAVIAMQEEARRYAASWGMFPYYLYRQKNTLENLANIGYAAEGCECAYNIHEMADRVDVLAAGAGAVSKFIGAAGTGRLERVFNVKNLLEYISRNDEMIERKRRYLAGRRKDTDI